MIVIGAIDVGVVDHHQPHSLPELVLNVLTSVAVDAFDRYRPLVLESETQRTLFELDCLL